MEYIILENFNNNIELIKDDNGDTYITESLLEAQCEANDCQNGLIIPINTDRLFTKNQVIDVLISFDQSMYPENYNSSKELESCDFADATISKAIELGLEKEFKVESTKYANATIDQIMNYNSEDLIL